MMIELLTVVEFFWFGKGILVWGGLFSVYHFCYVDLISLFFFHALLFLLLKQKRQEVKRHPGREAWKKNKAGSHHLSPFDKK